MLLRLKDRRERPCSICCDSEGLHVVYENFLSYIVPMEVLRMDDDLAPRFQGLLFRRPRWRPAIGRRRKIVGLGGEGRALALALVQSRCNPRGGTKSRWQPTQQ